MAVAGKTSPEQVPRSCLCPLGLFIHITSVTLEKRLITDQMLSKFPVVLGQGIPLFSRDVVAEIPIRFREKVDLKANQRIEIAF